PGHHDGSHHYPDDRGNATASAANRARGGLWSRGFALAHHPFHYASHRDLRRHHGSDAGVCPRGGGNGAPAVYGVRQPVLELEDEPAHGRLVSADFHVRNFTIRRV